MSEEQILQPGVKEQFQILSQTFWDHVDRRMPAVIEQTDRAFVNEALLLALAALRVNLNAATQ